MGSEVGLCSFVGLSSLVGDVGGFCLAVCQGACVCLGCSTVAASAQPYGLGVGQAWPYQKKSSESFNFATAL